MSDYFLTSDIDHGGHAECVVQVVNGRVLYNDSFGWMWWNGSHFELGSQITVKGVVKDVLKQRRQAALSAPGNKNSRAIMDAIQKSSKRNRSVVSGTMDSLASESEVYVRPVSVFDTSPYLLNCVNGVIDLRTGELAPHSPAQRFTYCVPTQYNPKKETEPWEDIVNEATSDDAITAYLQEATGYSISGSTQEEVLFYIWGPSRGGKGTFIETILSTLGRMPIATEVDFRTLTQTHSADPQNFALAPLRPCRFVAASESTRAERLNAAKIKALTGGNDVYCAHKGKPHFSYRPQYKFWLSSNWPVNADPDDNAVWARVRVIEFPNSFLGKEDKHRKERLLTPDNLSAVLTWMVKGAVKWYERGSDGLPVPEKVTALGQRHRDEQDYVQQWLDENIEKTAFTTDYVLNARLYGAYSAWCQDAGVKPKGIRAFVTTLKLKDFDAGVQIKYKMTDPHTNVISTHNKRGCRGIRFKNGSR